MSQMNAGPGGQPQTGKPGQMTAVMRAMAQAAGPKVLRIGLVQGGRIIEERVIKQRTSVTVGPSEKAMFVIPAPNIPAQFKLFEIIGPDYYLNFLDGMTGRVALQTGITDISALKGQAKRGAGNTYQVKLTEEARGKVIVGDTTFLFQFVAPPPPQPRPQLPLAVKGGLASQIDWNLTVIAAFSFMLHFGLVGAMYSDWMDPVVNEDLGIQGLIDMAKNLPPPPVEEKPVAEDKSAKDDKKAADKPADKPATGGKAGPSGPATPRVSEARAAALSAQAEAMAMQLLGAKNGAGPSTSAVLNSGSDIAIQDLSNAAKSGAGVSASGSDLRMGAGGGPVQPGRGGNGLSGIGGSTAQQGQSQAGTVADKGGPKAGIKLEPVQTSGSVSGAESCVAKMSPRFRSCYQRGLSSDPSMSGKVVLAAKVSPNGEVSSVDVVSNSGLSAEVVSCIQGIVRRADCFQNSGANASVNIPVSFVQQK